MSSGSLPPPPPPDDDGRGLPQPPPDTGQGWGWGDPGSGQSGQAGQGWGSQPGSGQWPPAGGQQGWGDPGTGWGGQPGYGGASGYPGQQRSNGLALASMICGLVSIGCLLLFFIVITIPLAVILSIAAIVTGILGLRAAREPGTGGRGQAITGLSTGVATLVLLAIGVFGFVALWQTTGFDSNPFLEPEEFISELEERGVEFDEEGRIDPEALQSELERDG